MDCDVCARPHTARRPFNCPTCARNTLYQPRIDHAVLLLEKDRLGSTVARATSKADKTRGEASELSRRYELEAAKIAKVQTDERIKETGSHISILRQEIKGAQQEISARRAALAERRRMMDGARQIAEQRRTKIVGTIESQIAKREDRWATRSKILEGHRAFLCHEAAKVYSLKCKRRMRNGVIFEQYSIGGVPIPDLREINNIKPHELSAAMANVAHFLLLTSNYLALRLPAEIIPPHCAFPETVILTPANSYTGREIPFPRLSQSSSTSPTGSRHADLRPPPRPRPLFTHKRLPQLSHDDPTAYSLFIEAISLLAWNVAWLCRTQGYVTGTENWEDICSMGRNLWQLFGPSPPITGGLSRARSSRDTSSRQRHNASNGAAGNAPPLRRTLSAPRLGHYSHGTAHTFLPGVPTNPNNYTFFQDWKLRRYTTISDPLKRTLLSEMSNAEWELLDELAWDDGTGDFGGDDETVFVKTNGQQTSSGKPGPSRGGAGSASDNRKINQAPPEHAGSTTTTQPKASTTVGGVSGAVATGLSNDMASPVPSSAAGAGTGSGTDTAGPETPAGKTMRGTSGWTKLRPRENT